ncbi:Sec-independent protein translocase protein TatB [Aliiroseovarius sp.]|uniref:Sec-independent protein translocase protein TatB n=1 Tax=Aliiroseovarius sp. TaxID=1872442 RepID=UPI003BABE5D6
MFDIGMTELLVIGIVALIVVGPKDLPGMFRTLGRFTAKARSLGREFSRAMNEAANESGVQDVAKDLKNVTNPKAMGLDALNKAADSFEKWDPTKPSEDGVKPMTAAERGGETAKLAQERAEAARKIHEATAKKAQARLDKEAAEAAEAAAAEAAEKTPAPTEKPDA